MVMGMTVKSQTQVVSPPAASIGDSLGGTAKRAKSAAKRTIDDAAMTPFLRKIVFFSSGGSFLDGYVLAIVGVALSQITPLFALTEVWSALIGASVFLGILIGTVLGGYLADRLGRRTMFIVDVIAIAAFSLFSVFANGPLGLVIARFFIGVFVGADYPIATSMIAEFTPTRHRSISMGMVSAAWYLGATVAAFVGYALFSFEDGWRWMLGSAVVPCVVLLVGRRNIPESPLWLERNGRSEEARDVLSQIYGNDVEFVEEEEASKISVRQLFSGGYGKRIAFLGVLTLCQVVPMYAIYTFGPQIMTEFGLGAGQEAILGESVVSLFFLVGTFPAMFWLNSFGRRKLLIASLAFMTLGLLVLGVFPSAPSIAVIAAFGLYAFFSGGPGILQWLYPNELFPTPVRASAVGVSIAISRIGTIVATYCLPLMLGMVGVGPTMLAASFLLAVGLILSVRMAPETKDKSLSETAGL